MPPSRTTAIGDKLAHQLIVHRANRSQIREDILSDTHSTGIIMRSLGLGPGPGPWPRAQGSSDQPTIELPKLYSTCMPHIFMHKWARATGHLVYRPSTRREFAVSYEVMHDVFGAFSSTFLPRGVH